MRSMPRTSGDGEQLMLQSHLWKKNSPSTLTRKWLLPKVSRWFVASPPSFPQLSIFTCFQENGCTGQETSFRNPRCIKPEQQGHADLVKYHSYSAQCKSLNWSWPNTGYTGFYGLKMRPKTLKVEVPQEGKAQRDAMLLARKSRRHRRTEFHCCKCDGLF